LSPTARVTSIVPALTDEQGTAPLALFAYAGAERMRMRRATSEVCSDLLAWRMGDLDRVPTLDPGAPPNLPAVTSPGDSWRIASAGGAERHIRPRVADLPVGARRAPESDDFSLNLPVVAEVDGALLLTRDPLSDLAFISKDASSRWIAVQEVGPATTQSSVLDRIAKYIF
jgi:hypothetical protein